MLRTVALNIFFYLIKFYAKTLTFDTVYLDGKKHEDRNRVYAVWHGQLLPLVLFYKYNGTIALVSKSKDGDIASFCLEKLGYKTIRGSSSRGGSEALLSVSESICRNGKPAAITVDGPKGPKFSVKPGAVYIAKKTSGLVIPVVCSVKHAKKFNSWDNFMFPLPFSKIRIIVGEAMEFNRNDEIKTTTEELLTVRQKMMEMTSAYSENFL